MLHKYLDAKKPSDFRNQANGIFKMIISNKDLKIVSSMFDEIFKKIYESVVLLLCRKCWEN